MTRAMMLCAGLSTRLGDLSTQCPKPLLPVCGIPIVRYGIANLVAHGITDIVINLHHHGELFRHELGDGSALGARIQYSEEPVILGTGGGLKQALALLDPNGTDEPFLSLNGKLIFDLDLTALLDAFRRDSDVLGMMVVRRVPDAMEWGAVDVDGSGPLRVRNILGEGGFMFGGVHVTRPSTVAQLPDGEACMVRQGYLPWMHKGGQVAAFVAGDGYFAEHSTPERYLYSNYDLLQTATLTHPPGELRGVDASASIDPEAKIVPPVRICAGATIKRKAVVGPAAVVGANATVEEDCRLRDSVVFAGATATGLAHSKIVTQEKTHSVNWRD